MTGTDARAHILIVDDDRLVLASVGSALREAGYAVTEANDIKSALARIQGQRPDLAILDVSLPDLAGPRLARQLAEGYDLPFMFTTSSRDPDLIKKATELGALGYLVKPLDTLQLTPSIEAALARAEQIRTLKNTGENLSRALKSGRDTSIAIGILMERRGLDRQEAFSALRAFARRERKRVEQVASDFVEAAEKVNKIARFSIDRRTV